MESAYKFTEYRYRFLKETKNIFSANSRTTAKSQERAPRDGGLSKTEQNFLELIQNDAVRRKETIKDIVLKCSATSFEVYIDEIKQLSWENSKLREELRRKDHVMDRKVNEEKQQAQIISQKNEQIRKISQEVEKTRSELKKVKTGVNKEIDQLNKSKKGRSTSNRRKREEILEIPVLPENISNDQQAKEACDIFFYDIPKYWSEDDVRTNLMKIGTVYRLQIRGQYKYKTVKAKIALNENFEKTFLDGHFGICISKHFIRWYDVKLDKIEERKDCSSKGYNARKKNKLTASEPKTPTTPPERIYRELGNFASRKESLLHPSKTEQPSRISKTPDENEVVEMIKNWRVGEDNTQDQIDTSGKKEEQVSLKKDNVAPEEVYQESTHEGLVDKLKEVKDIFNQTSNEMEWNKINDEAINTIRSEHGITSHVEARKWAIDKNNFFLVGNKIISLAEKTKIFLEYTTLNDNFKQRLENNNRYQDDKKIGEKRPLLESPKRENDMEEFEPSDEEEISLTEDSWAINYQEDQQQQRIQLTMRNEIEKEKKEKVEAQASTSSPKKAGGKKKKKNKKKN
ncbi:hypothetical protein RhiirA1_443404 [Rhizophagus irregularis]|uniref:Uncharacterized protein n=1 Tax=Rhizophagus irregularis TaxID=588596 RepID=A0A2N0RJ37_9GLOM|nr:hypothetical protein RhiirA1_443404 [Rhizophagus irregularis]